MLRPHPLAMAVGAGEAARRRAKAAVQGLTGSRSGAAGTDAGEAGPPPLLTFSDVPGLEREGRTPARPASLHTQIMWDVLHNQLGNN